jgi:hypothetical protein
MLGVRIGGCLGVEPRPNSRAKINPDSVVAHWVPGPVTMRVHACLVRCAWVLAVMAPGNGRHGGVRDTPCVRVWRARQRYQC